MVGRYPTLREQKLALLVAIKDHLVAVAVVVLETIVTAAQANKNRLTTALTGYCTRKYLLGLVKGTTLDSMCPNVALHRQNKSINDFSGHHPVSYQKWSQLLKKQIDELLYRGIEDLWISGTLTGLFAVTLLGYGYKFVGKGTPKSNADRFGNEACVYHRLEPIQGTFVPVYLGTIDLCKMDREFPHRSGHTLGFMMFLSWAGDRLSVSDKAYWSLKDRGVKGSKKGSTRILNKRKKVMAKS
ncbi:hypothetical protein CFIMG_008102RA00001 [Ceratocystis fimbriata CBS 114723]|uniref:Uncharacterized protein n=1 Tax=Ceratocystis fimbriata CBS 114723 TaxID=1035309 RepID=A0A2C5WYB8_9PEZI|nr:hypothetical protein CFIMG_008102RA00001 [Ceratocystis fimbriata CBS 114723]